MGTTSLPLSEIIPVEMVIAPIASPGPVFNQALIVGSSDTIPSVGANSRVQQFTSLAAIATAGFAVTDPEYLAASLYFAQTPKPTYLWLGRQDLTAISAVTIAHGGADYAEGDIVGVVQTGGSFGVLRVTSVGSSSLDDGIVTGLEIVEGSQGTGYSIASGLNTTDVTGSGSGLTVNITAIGESPAQAVAACRSVSPIWYTAMFVGTHFDGTAATDADYAAVAQFIEAATPASIQFLTTSESDVLNGVTPNMLSILKALNLRRTWSMYSTTQGGTFPLNIYASAAAMGYAMGSNTGAAGSYWDIMFKAIASVAPEPLTQSQVTAISGSVDRSSVGYNGNLMLNYANGAYQWIQCGTMASGAFLDEVVNLDILAAALQANGVALLTSIPAVPLTDLGVTMMKTALATACDQAQSVGFIAQSGTWTGIKVGAGNAAIGPGDTLPKGYYIYAPPVSTLSAGQRAARIMPPITILLIESQSGHSLSVTVNVQR